MTVVDIINQALELPEKDRALVAERLIDSLGFPNNKEMDADLELTPKQMAEVERRARQLDAGEVEGIPAEEVFKRALERFE